MQVILHNYDFQLAVPSQMKLYESQKCILKCFLLKYIMSYLPVAGMEWTSQPRWSSETERKSQRRHDDCNFWFLFQTHTLTVISMTAGSYVNAKVSQIHAEVRMRFGSYAGGDDLQTLHLKKWSGQKNKGLDARFLKVELVLKMQCSFASCCERCKMWVQQTKRQFKFT